MIGHIAPSSFEEYWSIRKGRGKGCPQVRFFLENWTLTKITSWAVLRIIKNIALIITLFPMALIISRATKKSHKRGWDFVPFTYAWLIEQLAFHVGEWESILEISKINISGKIKSKAQIE